MTNKTAIGRLIVALALVGLLPGTANATDDLDDWYLLTQNKNGTVSINGHLLQKDCEFWSKRLRGLPATPEEIEAAQVLAEHESREAAEKREEADAACRQNPQDQYVASLGKWEVVCQYGEVIGVSSREILKIRVNTPDIVMAACFRRGEAQK